MSENNKPLTKPQLQARLNQVENQLDKAVLRLNESIQLNAYLSRESMATMLGQSFGGTRDLYTALGYKKEPVFQDYLNFYDRDGIATRIVESISNETWKDHPILTQNKFETPDEENPSPLQAKFEELADELDLWAKFNEVDVNCGISRFGLMFLGLPGETDEPFDGKSEIVYITTHDEGDAVVEETSIIKDTTSPRFGLPEFYKITFDEDTLEKRVHWTRVIHVKEGKERGGHGRIYGVPRLKKILNRLYDLEKVVGAGSEAFWKLIYRGLALSAKEGFQVPPKGSDERDELIEEATDYQNDFKRFMLLSGMDITDLGGKSVDSRNQFDVVIAYLAGASEEPQRKLVGSEEGKLASTQDASNRYGFVKWRRENFAEPYILRPFLRRAAELGLLEKRKRFFAYWPNPFKLTDEEEAGIALTIAQAINQITNGAPESAYPAEEFTKRLPGKWKFVFSPDSMDNQTDENTPLSDGENVDMAGGNGNTPEAAKPENTFSFSPNILQRIRNVLMPKSEIVTNEHDPEGDNEMQENGELES